MPTNLRASMGSVNLDLPNDLGLLAAAGRVALAHGQLELMLRMTIRTLSGLSLQEALDATKNSKNWELRAHVKKLVRQNTKNESLRLKANAILESCARLSEKRNWLLHNAWAIAPDGTIVVKGNTHAWGKAASVADLDELARQIADQVARLNHERLRGFIHDMCPATEERSRGEFSD